MYAQSNNNTLESNLNKVDPGSMWLTNSLPATDCLVLFGPLALTTALLFSSHRCSPLLLLELLVLQMVLDFKLFVLQTLLRDMRRGFGLPRFASWSCRASVRAAGDVAF